jgi:hypothetical protein
METTRTAADALFNVDATDASIAPEIMVARDAVEQGRPDAYKLLVGLPATVGIGSDSYAQVVVKTTPKTITLDDGRGVVRVIAGAAVEVGAPVIAGDDGTYRPVNGIDGRAIVGTCVAVNGDGTIDVRLDLPASWY